MVVVMGQKGEFGFSQLVVHPTLKEHGHIHTMLTKCTVWSPLIVHVVQHPPHRIKINDMISLKKSGFNTSNPTKIIIHGFQSSIKEDVFVANKNAYMESGDYNVIGMDWSSLCEFEYLSAVGGARRAGKILAEFLNWLSGTGVALNELHLVGHSLGAHVAGIAGHQIKTGLIGRITGLDPAAPGFREVDPELKLDVKDAKLVDIIHTYIRVLSIAQPMGHIDFYPNGGRWQPGCPDIYDICEFFCMNISLNNIN
ncbi:hypothetical protein Zmor_006249 [Zophobas morio]|uniref:Lipase domain-containing protein n=1 Tax=Zophobas morio TaxID=2755281 RepID=A0AA38IX11_9CUCU|nr:hypothetical protein Zmor_006249 [Zophobas morio]